MAVGGSVESVSIAGRNFPATGDADVQVTLGGYTNAYEANGDGTARLIKTRVPWMITGLVLEVDHTRGDQEFIQDAANGTSDVPISITYASGVTFQGSGLVVDEINASSQSASMTVALGGSGELTQQ
jgi:hypothetical protein